MLKRGNTLKIPVANYKKGHLKIWFENAFSH